MLNADQILTSFGEKVRAFGREVVELRGIIEHKENELAELEAAAKTYLRAVKNCSGAEPSLSVKLRAEDALQSELDMLT